MNTLPDFAPRILIFSFFFIRVLQWTCCKLKWVITSFLFGRSQQLLLSTNMNWLLYSFSVNGGFVCKHKYDDSRKCLSESVSRTLQINMSNLRDDPDSELSNCTRMEFGKNISFYPFFFRKYEYDDNLSINMKALYRNVHHQGVWRRKKCPWNVKFPTFETLKKERIGHFY